MYQEVACSAYLMLVLMVSIQTTVISGRVKYVVNEDMH